MGKNWAIAIGINDYYNLKPLRYAKRDAEAMRDFCLEDASFERVYFFAEGAPPVETDRGPTLRSEPTIGNLERFLRVRFEREFLQAGDNLWFFFAGHGKRHQGRDYLMPVDGDPGNVGRTGLAIRDISDRLRRCGADNVILMLDACRGEDDRHGGQGIGVEKQQGVITIFSCSPNELSYEIEELQQGAFTYALLQGLRIQGEGNCATVERLYQYLRYQVPELNRLYGQLRQTPYAIAEPATKLHLILLPQQATLQDVLALKNDAYKAEDSGDLSLAEQLWIRVLAVSHSDLDAIAGIRRVDPSSKALSTHPTRLNRQQSLYEDSFCLSLFFPITRSQYSLALVNRRRVLKIAGSLCAGIGVAALEMRSFSTVNQLSDIQGFQPEEKIGSTVRFSTVTITEKGKILNVERKSANYRIERIEELFLMEMILIPAGVFTMSQQSDDETLRADTDQQSKAGMSDFEMSKYAVTQAQWQAVASLPRVQVFLDPRPSRFKGDELPVEQVSWYEAVEFCERLSKRTGRKYRLPSETEWEYACRARTMTPFHLGETITPDLANYNCLRAYRLGPTGEYRGRTTIVGKFPPNDFGLYDMHGNVSEWCTNHWYDNDHKPILGNEVLAEDRRSQRIIRGGSWLNYPEDCESSHRAGNFVNNRDYNVGFRVVCSIS
ncbi:MAG: SUMF1/EgtB/PvdO family nonheme iron enzyme [Cyanobacteria bacterium P01_A01_bin.135]